MNQQLLLVFVLIISLTWAGCGTDDSSVTTSKDTTEDFGPLPENSIYNLEGTFTTQHGEEVTLGDLRGAPVVMAMVFTNCDFACPTITQEMKGIRSELESDLQEEVQFLLVSFDVARDTSEQLMEFSRKMDLGDNWTLLHGNEQDVRQLSMLLNTHYKSIRGGTLFSHDNVITVLDRNGEIVMRDEGLGQGHEEVVQRIHEL